MIKEVVPMKINPAIITIIDLHNPENLQKDSSYT
jgi:hypothetical protein